MTGVLQATFMNQRSFAGPPGQQAYTTAGTYTWVAPTGVTSVSVVCVGSGSSIYAGALSYKNNISVTPGNSYTVKVGSSSSSQSYFIDTSTVRAGITTDRVGDGGGNGGQAQGGGGGGVGILGQGTSGAGGAKGTNTNNAAGAGRGGGGGSGGANGATPLNNTSVSGGNGGAYGGGGAYGAFDTNGYTTAFGTPAAGAVRIIWPGTTRSFPSTNTGDL